MLTADQLREYATTLLLDHLRDTDAIDVHGPARHYLGEPISIHDGALVYDLMNRATITIELPAKTEEHAT